MSKSITRCPKCHTAFRVTDTHLSSAKGAVRCGSCLNIFNAKDFLVSQSSSSQNKEQTKKVPQSKSEHVKEAPTKAAPTKQASIATSRSKTRTVHPASKQERDSNHTPKSKNLDDDDILISDDFDLENEEEIQDDQNSFDENTIFTKSKTSSTNFNLFERKTIHKEEDDGSGDTDESWALDLLRDDKAVKFADDTPKKDPKFNKGPTGRFAAFELIDNAKEENTVAEEPHPQEHIHQTTAEKIRAEPAVSEQVYLNTDDEYIDDYIDENMDHRHESDDQSIDDSAYYTDPQYSSSAHKYIDSIEPEPVEFSWKKHGGNIWYSNTFWMILSILAFTLSIGQLAYFKFDKLSRIEPYRNYYAISCNIIGCKLPALVDISKIRTVNLVIRSHPNVSGELLVDAVIQNDAPFDQVFPSLDLIFTDINNQPIAAKRFKPSEYLAGELAGRHSMPSRQPIHIALQIEDPGPAAINYQMTISQAKN